MKALLRKIIHIDMDAFYASCEQRDYPGLRGKPIAVGSEGRRGIVAAASYEARKYGVHSAMPGALARQKCKELIFVKGRHSVYREVSGHIMEIFKKYSDLVEPLSLDEAFIDVTKNHYNISSATQIAKEIRRKIRKKTKLTASAGVSFNKFLAKVASDFNKPDGLTVIPPKKAAEFINALDIRKIPGVGRVTEEKMLKLGIKTGADLRRKSLYELNKYFGKTGTYFYEIIRGLHNPPVTPERIPKSIGAERTFYDDISGSEEMLEALKGISDILLKRINKKQARGKGVTLKIKYFDFEQHTRSKTFSHFLNPRTDLFTIAKELFFTPVAPIKPVRLLGITLTSLDSGDDKKKTPEQLVLDF